MDVLLPNRPAAEAGPSGDKACGLCFKSPGKYTCPRCGVKYCTTDCYRSEKHGECSETFYQECVLNELRFNQVGPEEKKKVLEMLQRLHMQEEGTEVDGNVPNAPIEGEEEEDQGDQSDHLDLDDVDADEIWEAMTSEQRAEFQRALADGRLANMLPVWTPWWQDEKGNGPATPTDVPPFSTLLPNRKPARELPFNLVDLIYTYVYTMHLYNGDCEALPVESCATIGRVSCMLGAGAVHPSTEHAIHLCMQSIGQDMGPGPQAVRHAVSLLADLHTVLSDVQKTLRALAHISSIFSAAVPEIAQKPKRKGTEKDSKSSELKSQASGQNPEFSGTETGIRKPDPSHRKTVSFQQGTKAADAVLNASEISPSRGSVAPTGPQKGGPRGPVPGNSLDGKTVKAWQRKVVFYLSWFHWLLGDSHMDAVRMAATLCNTIKSEADRLHRELHEVQKPNSRPIASAHSAPIMVTTAANQIPEKKMTLPDGTAPKKLIEEL